MRSGTERGYARLAALKRRNRIRRALLTILVIAAIAGGAVALVLRSDRLPPRPGGEAAAAPTPARSDDPIPPLSSTPERIVPRSPARGP